MPSPFDGLAARVTSTVARVMGYPATWSPTGGGADCSGRVLFKSPTEQQKLDKVPYDPEHPTAELVPADFPGLYEVSRAGSREVLVIDGHRYGVRTVRALHDGGTWEAELKRLPDAP
jgi:hypothetical protein